MTHPINKLLGSINRQQRFEIEMIVDEVQKIQEVKKWIEASPTTPPIENIKSYIDNRWPELQSELRENIFIVALGETF